MRITKDRMVGVLGPAAKPTTVWERQFDYHDDVLVRLSKTDWDKVPDGDLRYYILDLTYMDLQPELFRHLFPACLKFWYDTLMRGEGAVRGDADFHYALMSGQIAEKMLSPRERQLLEEFFCAGFLDRVESERGFVYEVKKSNVWIGRFNSLGIVAPVIPRIWKAWWTLDHPGKAVCAVMYASGLVYFGGENPIYTEWGPHLTQLDSSIFDWSWRNDNLKFLMDTLSVDYITAKLEQAAAALSDCPEAEMASRVANDAKTRTDVIELRIGDLLENLARVQLAKDRWD